MIQPLVLIRGAGDIATGIAVRLFRSGLQKLVLLERPSPLALRRQASFSEAVYEGVQQVEGVTAALAASCQEIFPLHESGCIAVLVDPLALSLPMLKPDVLIDATRPRQNSTVTMADAPLVVGIGSGFTVGHHAHRVVESQKGPNLGRVIRSGRAAPADDSPDSGLRFTTGRMLCAPDAGMFFSYLEIGEQVEKGDTVGFVRRGKVQRPVQTSLSGVVRGLLRSGLVVKKDMCIGEIDPRPTAICHVISARAFAIGGGVLEALLEYFNRPPSIRKGVLLDQQATSVLRSF